jgi:MATE family multidrug resistance protein
LTNTVSPTLAHFNLWNNIRHVLALAVPVALAELGWVSMNVVDTIMVGHLGPSAIGAIAIGGSIFYAFAIFGTGVLLGLDTLVSQAFGAGDREDCRKSLAAGVYFALFLAPVLMLFFYLAPFLFGAIGIDKSVSMLAGEFIHGLSLSTLPLLLYSAFRRYLQAMGHVRPVMFTLVSANVVNWFFNWLLIEGHWGFPALGVKGSALSTVMARIYMAALLLFCIWWFERRTQPLSGILLRRPDWKRMRLIGRLGLPAATQILLEIGAFGTTALLAGRLTPTALAAHQIAINVASVSFMVPLGIGSAAAVTVGHSIGRRESRLARYHGFIALGIAGVFALCAASVFLSVPHSILRIYTDDAGVLRMGTALLVIAAAFQLFDAIQTVATGALRGLGNTRIPMLVNLGGYWFFGLPIGYVLCFRFRYGVYGLWAGLTLALTVIALLLLYTWNRQSRLIAAPAGW